MCLITPSRKLTAEIQAHLSAYILILLSAFDIQIILIHERLEDSFAPAAEDNSFLVELFSVFFHSVQELTHTGEGGRGEEKKNQVENTHSHTHTHTRNGTSGK